MLAGRLVSRQRDDKDKIKRVLDFLCSDSGSHDYTIHRREAKDELGLNVEKPTQEGYLLLKEIHDDLARELELANPLDPSVILGNASQAAYSFRRAILESVAGGCHVHTTRGEFRKQGGAAQLPPGIPAQLAAQIMQAQQQQMIIDERTFEGWVHEAST